MQLLPCGSRRARRSPSTTSSPRTPGLSGQRPTEEVQSGAHYDHQGQLRTSDHEDFIAHSIQGGLPWAKPQRTDSLTIADYHHPPGFGAPQVGETEGWTSPGFASHGPHSAPSPYWPSAQST